VSKAKSKVKERRYLFACVCLYIASRKIIFSLVVVADDEISYYGPPAHKCQYCGAQFWYQERVKRTY